MKTTWKAFEETIGRGRNRSIEAWLVTDGDVDDDDNDADGKTCWWMKEPMGCKWLTTLFYHSFYLQL
jgi:hypothetical protein